VRTYLDDILARHRRAAAADRRDVARLREEAAGRGGTRDFAAALRGQGLAVIAEVKRRSPSKGDLGMARSAADMAQAYATGGAACLSVLTDADSFGGSPDDLREARAAVPLPVLRKDFTVGPADVCDARLMGADAVLLIAVALSDAELAALGSLARELGMAALYEVHDETEVERVLAAGAEVVGVNQRDLRTFAVDTSRAVRVAAAIPSSVVKVAESGIDGPEDAAALAEAGFDAVLVGESLVRAPDPAAAVAALRAAPVRAR
jgi:indole-3-glycerol phosphate synthase